MRDFAIEEAFHELSRLALAFSLAAQSEIFYSGFTAVIEPVKAPGESPLACARRKWRSVTGWINTN